MAEIIRVREVDSRLTEAFGRLIPQLSESLRIPTAGELQQIVASASASLFCAEEQGRIVGVLTLVWYDVPSGRHAWIEDVVVDASQRGRGTGTELVRAALEEAARIGAGKVSLTSHASREAAHSLYRKMGFERYDTTVFRQKIRE